MTTYRINDKTYELKLENVSKTIWPHLVIELVADDEAKTIFENNLDQVDGSPELSYAGGGKFWDEDFYANNQLTHDQADVYVTPAEWCKQEARRCAEAEIDQVVCFPADYECDNRAEMVEEVREWLTDQYETLFGMHIDAFVENRLAEEKEGGDK